MKKFTIMILMIALFLASAFSVSALNVDDNFGSNSPTFGNLNQVASNPDDDDADRDDTIKNRFAEGTVTVSPSAGVATTTITKLEFKGFGKYTASVLKFRFDDKESLVFDGLNIPVVGSETLQIAARIPENLDAVDINLQTSAFKTSVLVITVDEDGAMKTVTTDIFMQRENLFRIDDIDARVISLAGTSKKQSLDPDDNDEIENVKPGDTIDFLITCENDANEDANLDMDTGEIEVDVDGRDFNENEDEDCEADADEDDEAKVEIEVDEDAEDQNAKAVFRLEGTDNFGARHGMVAEGKIEIDRERNDIQVKSVRFQPEALQCTDSSLQVVVDILNLGRSDEDEVAVEIDIRGLGLRDRKSGFELDEDDEDSVVFDFQVDPRTIDSGVHGVQIRTFTDNNDLSNSEVVQLKNDCGAEDVEDFGAAPITGRPSGEQVGLTLGKTRVTANVGSSVSVPVEIENTGREFAEFTVAVEGVEDFAEAGAPKKVALNPGQRTTVFLSVGTNDDAREGSYSGTVVVQRNGFEVGSEAFEAVVRSADEDAGLSGTTWIVLDIILALLAIFVVVMIFRKRR